MPSSADKRRCEWKADLFRFESYFKTLIAEMCLRVGCDVKKLVSYRFKIIGGHC